MTADLFGPSRRPRPGRCRRDLDAEVSAARVAGRIFPPAILAAARSLADTLDAAAEHIAARRAAHTEPPTGLVMAQAQVNREYRETLAVLLGVTDDRDPLDSLLEEFAAAASREHP